MSDSNNDATGLPDSINELGRWPQRLLHVESMTSCTAHASKGAPGTRPVVSYKHPHGQWYDEPAYRALSYTWGRFEIKDPNVAKSVQGLVVKNIDWEVPKIDPTYFTHQEFGKAITHARQPFPDNDGSSSDTTIVEFVWVDIVCIDQRDILQGNNVMKAVEIGRQADIFQQSIGAVAWLWGDMHFVHKDALNVLRQHCDTDFAKIPTRENVALILKTTMEILEHQWFKSLWTLQEAFVSRGEQQRSWFLLGRSAQHFLMDEFLSTLTKISLIHAFDAHLFPQEFGIVLNSMEQSGFWKARRGSPITLLSVSRNRTPSRQEDHVYGIMQVFGYRLGVASDPSKHYDIAELLAQFGGRLLEDYPVESQLHVFRRPPQKGASWHMDLSSSMRGLGQEVGSANEVSLSKTTLSNTSIEIGYFRGQCCPITHFIRLEQARTDDVGVYEHELFVRLDASEVPGLPSPIDPQDLQKPGRYFDQPTEMRSFFDDYLSAQRGPDGGSDDIVLLLARPRGCGYGLILHSDELEGTRYWRRVGVLQWNGQRMCEMADASGWSFREGYFG